MDYTINFAGLLEKVNELDTNTTATYTPKPAEPGWRVNSGMPD